MLCYNIANPASLFSAINFWVPELRLQAPSTPIVLVGCQSDLRTELGGAGRGGQTPVSAQQALAMSQQIEAVMYVETSAKTSVRGVASAMEVAALTSLGQFSPAPSVSTTTSPQPLPLHHRQSSLATTNSTPSPLASRKARNRSLSVTRAPRNELLRSSLKPAPPTGGAEGGAGDPSLHSLEPAHAFWDQFPGGGAGKEDLLTTPKGSPRGQVPHHGDDSPLSSRQSQGSPRSPNLNNRSKMGSLSSMSMRSKSSTLSSTKSDASMNSVHSPPSSKHTISISTKTPKQQRKVSKDSSGGGSAKAEKMITIKCQRLTADRTYEEVEIEVPAPVYETMQHYTENGGSMAARHSPANKAGGEKRGGFGTKIKCLFSKTAN